MKSDDSNSGWYFLIGVIILYVLFAFFNLNKILNALNFFYKLLLKIIPVLIIILILMFITNYFIKKQTIMKLWGSKSGIVGLIISVIAGILSSGPIYMWYPLLAELKKKGVNYGFIAIFLYNRAIKLPLLPIIIVYFGLKFTIILSIVMILASLLQGVIINKIFNEN